ncbi:MAG: DUF4159 domain-containing protein [Planctomycetota bacterium]
MGGDSESRVRGGARPAQRHTQARLTLIAAMLSLILTASVAAQASSGESDESDTAVATLVERLAQEANRLPIESLDRDVQGPAPTLLTPHPFARRSASRITDADVPAVIEALRDVRGNDLADRYARFHLLGVLQSKFIRSNPVRDLDVDTRQAMGEAAVAAYAQDQPMRYLRRDFEETRYREPRELYKRYNQLNSQTAVRVGVPPFMKTLYGEAALRAATGSRADQIRALLEERRQIESQLSPWINDNDARDRNNRKNDLDDIVRRARFRAAQIAMASGHGPSIEKLLNAAAASARSGQLSGIDVIDAALRTIVMGHAPRPDMDESDRQRLVRTLARGSGSIQIERLREGNRQLDLSRSPRRDVDEVCAQLAEYFARPERIAALYREPGQTAPPPPRRNANQALTIENIRAAIDQAQRALNSEGASWAVRQTQPDMPPHIFREAMDFGNRSELDNAAGRQAILAWSLVATGQPGQSRTLLQRIHASLGSDPHNTFTRSMRVILASELPADIYEPRLRRDLRWVVEAMTDKGGWGTGRRPQDPWGDHASAQYAIYALTSAARAGVSIPTDTWEAVDQHWRVTQQQTPGDQPAGWRVIADPTVDATGTNAFTPANGGVIATAGGIAALNATSQWLRDSDPARQRAIDKGVAWLDRYFTTRDDPNAPVDWFFTMWAVQNVGRSTGLSTFNDVDWFRDVTPAILRRQHPVGHWSSAFFESDLEIPTGAALLYLATALDPIAVGRLEHAFGWDHEPAALTTFARYASDRYERETISTSVRLDRPLDQLLDAPLLFIGATEPVQFTDAEIDKLRAYCQHGGLILLNPSQPASGVGRSFGQLLERLAPDRELEDVEPDDPIYGVHRDVRPSIRMRAVGSDIRPWAIWLLKDIGEDLANTTGDNDAVSTLSNLYLYRVGRNPRRTRLATSYLEPVSAPRTVAAARLRHDGDWDPEPAALEQLSRFAAASHRVGLRTSATDPQALSSNTRLAFLTTAGDGTLTADQAAAIRAWCEQGGTLVLDAAGGSAEAADSAAAMLAAIFPDRSPLPLSPASPVIAGTGSEATDRSSVAYRLFTLQRGVLTDRPRLSAVMLDDRPAVIYSPEDLTCGWAGAEHWGIHGYTIDDARGLGANIIATAAR